MFQIQLDHHGSPDVLVGAVVPGPVLQAHEVRIRTEAAGVNFADVLVRRGTYPIALPLPAVPGYETAGVITDVGADLGEALVGRRVLALHPFHGGYRSHVVAPAEGLVHVPDGVSSHAATALGIQGLTAYSLLHRDGGLTAGQTVLVHSAAGGVGSLAVQLATAAGARVIALASADKHERARQLGAAVTIDSRSPSWVDQVREHAPGGVDLVLDGVGGEGTISGLGLLAAFGRLVYFGTASGEQVQLDARAFGELQSKSASIVGGNVLNHALRDLPAAFALVAELLDQVASGTLAVDTTNAFPLTEDGARAAHQAIEDRRTTGKVALIAE